MFISCCLLTPKPAPDNDKVHLQTGKSKYAYQSKLIIAVFNQWDCQQWLRVTDNKRTTCRDARYIQIEEDQSAYTHQRQWKGWKLLRGQAQRERLTVCTLERQSSGKLTHTAAGWECSERWQPEIKEGGRNGAMSNVRQGGETKEKDINRDVQVKN